MKKAKIIFSEETIMAALDAVLYGNPSDFDVVCDTVLSYKEEVID